MGGELLSQLISGTTQPYDKCEYNDWYRFGDVLVVGTSTFILFILSLLNDFFLYGGSVWTSFLASTSLSRVPSRTHASTTSSRCIFCRVSNDLLLFDSSLCSSAIIDRRG